MIRRPVPFVVAVAAIALAWSGSAHGRPLDQGTCELAPAVSFAHSSYSASGLGGSASITALTINGFVGYCVSERVEVGGSLLLNHFSGDAGDATSGGVTFGGTLNFASGGTTVPYLRGSLGFLTNSGGGDTSVLVPVLEGGLRVLVGSASSVNFGVSYTHQTNALGISDVSGNIIAFTVGVSIFPGS